MKMRRIIYAAWLALIPACFSQSCILPPNSTIPDDAALSQSLAAALQSIAELQASDGGFRYNFDIKSSTAIGKSLEKYKLNQWGFVIFRCTYSSQEKWDTFVALAKQGAHEYFERYGIEDLAVYDKMAWTIIEDAGTLDGASIVDTSHRFREWGSAGKEEMQGSVLTDTWHYDTRYLFYMHVDEESLESVVGDEKARERSGYFCTMVYEIMVTNFETAREAGEIPDDLDEEELLLLQRKLDDLDEDELRDFTKKFKLDDLVDVYAGLLNPNSWYNSFVDDSGVADVPGLGQEWA